MATVRELVVSLGLDFNSSGFAKAEGAIAALRVGFAGVGALLVGVAAGLTGITVAVSKQADELNDLSVTLGVSTDAIQRLGFAAQMSGANQETMRAGLLFLSRSASAAADGGKEAAEQFAKFGVTLKDQHGQLKTADRLFLDVANGIGKMKSPTEQAAAAAHLLGRQAGPQLVQLLKQGEAGIAALGDELEGLGGLMDSDFIAASVDFNDTLDRMQAAIKGIGITIAKAFLPFLSSAVKGLVEWYRANREVISSRVTFFVERMASAFRGLGGLIGVAVGAVGKIVGALTNANPLLVTTIAIVAALALAFASPAFAIVLLSALVLAIADDINTFVTGGKSVLGDFAAFLFDWGRKNEGVFAGMAEAVGGFLLAFKGGGWAEVMKEADAHVQILLHTLEKVAAIGRLVLAPLLAVRALTKEGREAITDDWETVFGGDGKPRKNKNVGGGVGPQKFSIGPWSEEGINGSAGVPFNMMKGLPGFLGHSKGALPGLRASASNSVRNSTVTGGASTSSVSVTQNIQAAPGQDPKDIGAGAIDRVIEEKRKAELRQAHSAFVPAKAAQ